MLGERIYPSQCRFESTKIVKENIRVEYAENSVQYVVQVLWKHA